ncbi:protein kinase domain-containing protein [Citrus sinensis]|uniref:Protein kinase domain-containing protein n=1 Tax=Citrus sinensis TaxID=2711 RepID=A0ACB8KVP2_CITSI|nr:protein kinase domain-containing protein [Citrus sinensis]
MLPERTDSSLSQRATDTAAERVIVAVRAEKVISKKALAWALTHVVHQGDGITLLAVFPAERTGDSGGSRDGPEIVAVVTRRNRGIGFVKSRSLVRKWGNGMCRAVPCLEIAPVVVDLMSHEAVRVRIKVVSGTSGSAVASEAMSNGANWVVLDKKLKQELKHCLEELHCNIVVMKNSRPKVLRLNLQSLNEEQTQYFSASASPVMAAVELQGNRMKHSTPLTSPERTSTSRISQQGLSSSSDRMSSLFLVYQQNPLFEGVDRGCYTSIDNQNHLDGSLLAPESTAERLITLSTNSTPSVASNCRSVFWIPQNHIVNEKPPKSKDYKDTNSRSPSSRTLLHKFIQFDQDTRAAGLEFNQSHHKSYGSNTSIRNAVPLGRTSSIPPPLCSLCQHKAPIFGKPPRRFSYKELEEATDGFSDTNFLAEGGFGVVYRGLLRDGQAVAVKMLKFGGSQADADFCREVRVLSCAQHRNVVLLIGFCIDGKKRVLVYEYICNGSLDFHLHGKKTAPLDWQSRVKIAIGAARGLRYLHEDCRVGCIVHRDMRPNNILLTHDFEPLVADFGLARWHAEWNTSTDERVIGTSGYLAPEYIDGGRITEKVDLYAFGVTLLELITGQRTSQLQFYKSQHVLSDWFHPLAALQPDHILDKVHRLIDPFLVSEQAHNYTHQLQAMARAAFLCLSRDPESRPPMSKVLRILEEADSDIPLPFDLKSVGNRSGHLPGLSSRAQPEIIGKWFSHYTSLSRH